jgi:hypothetical protein
MPNLAALPHHPIESAASHDFFNIHSQYGMTGADALIVG